MSEDPPAGLETEPATAQLEWFSAHDVGARPHSWWERYYCESVQHVGFHCESCIQDEGYGFDIDDACCCRAIRD